MLWTYSQFREIPGIYSGSERLKWDYGRQKSANYGPPTLTP